MLFRILRTLPIVIICLSAVIASAQDRIEIGPITGTSSLQTRTIQVTGQPASLVTQASRLFDLHGGLKRVAARADFTLVFTAEGGSGVKLAISSSGRALWSGSFQGATQRDALTKAADAAVTKTLGTPGFFQSKIAFISDRTGKAEVYVSDILFQAVRQLSRDGNQCLSPNLSPDGRSLLYTSYHGTGFPDIYHVNLATGQRKVFAGFKGTNTGATFSPDGRMVAMVLSGSGNSEIYLSNSQGGQVRRLTRRSSLEADPAFSPDGRKIVFTSDQMGGPQIYTMDIQGRSIARVRTDVSRNCSEPTWNPQDASQIAFTAAVAGEFEVAVYSFKENRSRIISSGAGDAVHPAWLNDGRHLIYTERTSRYSRLVVLDTVTGNRARLSPTQLNDAREASPIYIGR
ncbi:MAG: biopolymer transporter Tol [Puniceicoccaceae bacterium]